jgi:hypothetical protein
VTQGEGQLSCNRLAAVRYPRGAEVPAPGEYPHWLDHAAQGFLPKAALARFLRVVPTRSSRRSAPQSLPARAVGFGGAITLSVKCRS